MIVWSKADPVTEIAEYFSNDKTYEWFKSQGREFNTKEDFLHKMSGGILVKYDKDINQVKNFELLQEGKEYPETYVNEYRLLLSHAQQNAFVFPCPILIEGSEDYLFSGNKRANMAIFLNDELWVNKISI